MARGTYLPWPVGKRVRGDVFSNNQYKEKNKHTSLGEEGAETLIRFLSLALLGEVTIGL